MKKLIASILCACMISSLLVGCGSNASTGSEILPIVLHPTALPQQLQKTPEKRVMRMRIK